MKFYKPTTFDDAFALAQRSEGVTRFLAGGTDVLVQLRSEIVTPDTLIDLKNIEGVKDIQRHDDGRWDIGIAVSGAEMSEHATLGAEWPGLVEAMDLIGSTQVQGRATLVGNLCNGSPAADSVPALMAAGASLSVIGPNGSRIVAVEDVPAGPGKTTLAADEIVTKIHLPARGTSAGDAYERFIPRTEMDIAVVGCGVNLRLDGPTIIDATIVMGAVAPTIRLVPAAAEALIGTSLDDAAKEKLSGAVRAACNPIDDKRGTIEFRTHVAGVLAQRVAQTAYDRARAAK